MRASVIIPTLNRVYALIDTVTCLLSQDEPDFEIIVVDQSPEYVTEAAERLKALCRDKRVIYLKESQRSLPHARNIGIARARGQYIIFVDDDVTVEADFVRQHCDFLQDRKVKAAAGRVIQKNFAEVGDLAVKFTRLARVEGAYLNSRVEREVDTFRGCNMAFNRTVFEECGGFDEYYTGNAAREESDMALRMKRRGMKILLNPLAAVVHLEAPNGGCRDVVSSGSLPSDQKAEFFKNDGYFFMKFFNHALLLRYVLGLYKVFAWDKRFRQKGLQWRQMKVVTVGVGQGLWQYVRVWRRGELLR